MKLKIDQKIVEFDLQNISENQYFVSIEGEQFAVKSPTKLKVGQINKQKSHIMGSSYDVMVESVSLRKTSQEVEGGLIAPMPGKVYKVMAHEGEDVKKGQTILILEAMKMEHPIVAPKDGNIVKLSYQEGDLVSADTVLVELK